MDENEQQMKISGQTNPGRPEKIRLVKIAEQCERYEDMTEYMKEIISMGTPLSNEERNLLSVAYKNVVGAKRSSWRSISNFILKELDIQKKEVGKRYLKQITNELTKLCNEVVELIDDSLLKTAENDESNIFYFKMKGDYYRYAVEGESDQKDKREELAAKSNEAYVAAYDLCQKKLPSYHPVRLGVALNFSVFHYEIKNEPDKACEIAKLAFTEALEEMNDLSPSMFKDSSLIMQLLRDNITMWKSESQESDIGNDND